MLKKHIKKVVLILLILILALNLPWIGIYFFSLLEPNPPIPMITYGEFPFRLEYKINDETHIIEDTIICEYDGFAWNEGLGKHRVWKKRLKCLGEENVLILSNENIKIYCNIGSAEYYMGDVKSLGITEYTPSFYYSGNYVLGGTEALLKEFKIELVEYQLSKPIENKFK